MHENLLVVAVVRGNAGWVRLDEPGLELHLRLDKQGRVTELYIDGGEREITAPMLRRIPLAKFRAQALLRPDLLFAMADAPDPGVRAAIRAAYPDEPARTERRRTTKPFELAPPTAGLTGEFLNDVARAYREAKAAGLKPNKELAAQTGVPRRTVERWTYLARKRGLLL